MYHSSKYKEEDQPPEIESDFILRLPSEEAEQLNKLLEEDNVEKQLKIFVDVDTHTAEIKLCDKKLKGRLVDLPCVVELQKTLDKKNFYKVTDVSQMVICEKSDDESKQRNSLNDDKKCEKRFQWPHGITPPMKNVRRRRFRKTLRKKYMDAPEIERELKILLRSDLECASVKYCLVSIDQEAQSRNSTTSANAVKTADLHGSNSESEVINVDKIFGEDFSTSSDESFDEDLQNVVSRSTSFPEAVEKLSSKDGSSSVDEENTLVTSTLIRKELSCLNQMDIFGSAINALKPTVDDDVVDRANYFYTPSLLLLFALIISTRQWIGQPIECWVPAEFKYAWEEYTENFCYIQDTYWLPLNDTIPGRSERGHKHISYYQWVPFILGVQALFFGAPFALWRICNFRSGFNIETIVSVARESTLKESWDDENSQTSIIAAFLCEVLQLKRTFETYCRSSGRSSWLNGKLLNSGSFLTFAYTLVKFLYVVNCSLQLLFMQIVLATGRQWMPNIFLRLLSGTGWEMTGVFPRVTMCDFEVRVLRNLNRYTVQCVLMINMVNEKIFLLVWCWTVVLTCINSLHLVYWLYRNLVRRSRREYIKKLVNASYPEPQPKWTGDVEKFADHFLRADGILVIEKVAHHAGQVVASRLTRRLFLDYILLRKRQWKVEQPISNTTDENQPNAEQENSHSFKSDDGIKVSDPMIVVPLPWMYDRLSKQMNKLEEIPEMNIKSKSFISSFIENVKY
ncbi:Innexin unc-9 [Trichinella nelsoni]|uniref:Innexin n=1 Tax=Trichinella nelsoni TaxID=6336 RepID=A0A0V0SGF8_9BILA|nr:Innexin unc-9 [Trichinella nelsoni]